MDRPSATQDYAADAARLAANGSAAVVEYVYALPESERLDAVRAVQRSLYNLAGQGAGLDLYVATMRELIDRGVDPLEQAGINEEHDRVRDSYNALSYNFAADLADCWPGQDLPREPRHFEAGLQAAEDCIRWRNELNKPPRSFFLAYWAKGYHLLALGHASGAIKSFNMALGFALRDAENTGKQMAIGQDGTFDVLLATAYLGIAEMADGNPSGAARYQTVIEAFNQQLRRAEVQGDSELKQDAELGLGQLEIAKAKYAP